MSPRVWSDLDLEARPLARLEAKAAAKGWKEYVGREPKPTDLIVPSPNGNRRGVSRSSKLVPDDVRRLGLEKQGSAGLAVTRIHYETRKHVQVAGPWWRGGGAHSHRAEGGRVPLFRGGHTEGHELQAKVL